MNTFFSKVTFLFTVYLTLNFAEACKKVDCECPSVLPYFDYKSLQVEANTNVSSGFLRLDISADSVEYLASAKRPEFSFLSSAYACDCALEGYNGYKYGIQSLNIYADRDFNDTLPSGASLNPIFFQSGGDVLVSMGMSDFQPYDFHRLESGIGPLSVFTSEKPTELNTAFRFRIEIVKSSGDILAVETGDIYFQ